MDEQTSISSFKARGGYWLLGQGFLFILYATALLAPIKWFALPFWGYWGQIAGALLVILGTWMGVSAFWTLGRSLTPFPAPLQNAELVAHGVYHVVRHPIYGALFLFGLGVAFWMNNLGAAAVAILLLLFFRLKSEQEEVFLVGKYPDYMAYQQKTRKRLIPFLW